MLGDETLRDIARELVETVRGNVTIDWTLRENVRANLRRLVRRILRKHGYPPDKQEKATQTVLEQAEVLSEGWALRLPLVTNGLSGSASFDYIEGWYNPHRRHSAIHYESPMNFERHVHHQVA